MPGHSRAGIGKEAKHCKKGLYGLSSALCMYGWSLQSNFWISCASVGKVGSFFGFLTAKPGTG